MSDIDTMSVATHSVGAITSGGLGAWITNFMRSRSEQQVAIQLALLRNDLDQVLHKLDKYDNYGERLRAVEDSLKAMHERQDSHEQGHNTRRQPRRKK